MLTALLIFFVIAIAIAPLLHFRPSKRQREVANMREYAALHGLFVEFRHPPSIEAVSEPIKNIIYYGKRLPSSRVNAVQSAAWRKTHLGWLSVGPRVPVPTPVEELPVEITAASVDQFSCGIYWAESDGERGVEQITQMLERWCTLLMK
jgi:hypothetical protein